MADRRDHIHNWAWQLREILLASSLHFSLTVAFDLGVLSSWIQLRTDAREAVLIAKHIVNRIIAVSRLMLLLFAIVLMHSGRCGRRVLVAAAAAAAASG